MNRILILTVGLALLLCGCPKRQAYEQPAPPVPAAWPEPAAGAAAAGTGAPAAADLGWREFFTDPKLQAVIERALEHNRDLRIAALNVDKIQALYRIQRAAQYPTVSAAAAIDAYRVPKNLSGADESETVAQYTLSLGATAWEIDFFGRIRSLKEQALEQYLATEQARSAAQISLVAAVAASYLTLAADQENLRLARATLDAQQKAYELIRSSRDFGIASDLDVHEAQSLVEAARVDIARYNGLIALDRNALDLVVGAPVPPDELPTELDAVADFREVAAGLPSDVLLRRPDIRAAEHQLRGAYANIEAARAAFFPRITLTAGVGLTSSDLADLFKFGSRSWNFVPQAVLPIFDWGTRQANYQVSQADRDIAIAAYESAIQSAFREVSDALSLRVTLVEQQNAQEALVKVLDQTCRLAEARYQAGIDGYLNVLVAQRALYNAQQGLVVVRLARRANRVEMYKVLGGGIEPGPAAP